MTPVEWQATLAQLHTFDEIIDVRSPAEFAVDHIPGAVNRPVLDNDERARVGTVYKQVSAFAAKRIGAALVARNIATHIETSFGDRPKSWRPLVYCWRGGGRSDAMVEVLRRIGWNATRLEGGYKAYRRAVVSALESLPAQLVFRTICGRTGVGKSLLLAELARQGAQVLDLEALARHRGSVLGEVPGEPQPTQTMFESHLRASLGQFAPTHPVFVESESRKVGNLQVPGTLLGAIRAAPCLLIEAPLDARVALLRRDYEHFITDTAHLERRLDALLIHHGAKTIAQWKSDARGGEHDRVVAALLTEHYDPAYDRSMARNYSQLGRAERHYVAALDAVTMRALARRILDACSSSAPRCRVH